ncbi:MAG: carboxypeptidase regulatory-like domain-containing protein, partial [Anaeromyxobacteraceae bacterium]
LPDLDPGRYLLGAVREGYTQSRATVARPGEEAMIELVRGGRVAGTVREEVSGKPVAPFRVEVRRGGRGWRLVLRAATVLDASGRFEIGDLPAGPLVVSASSPGHLPSPEVEVTVPDGGGTAEVDLRLGLGGRISGRVVDRVTGSPLPGARATLESEGASAPSLLDAGASAITGADGTFLVAGVPARTVTLHVEAEGHHSRIVAGVAVPEGGQGGPVEVKLSPVAEGEEPRVELAGIGATLERRGRGALRIAFVAPGGGAAEAGLVAGDEILQVEGRPVADLGLSGAVDLIRGPEDTRVRLVVRRGEAPATELYVWRRLVRG